MSKLTIRSIVVCLLLCVAVSPAFLAAQSGGGAPQPPTSSTQVTSSAATKKESIMSVDPARIALDLVLRSTPAGGAPSRSIIETDYTHDAEQVNGLGTYSAGREAIISTVQKVMGTAKTVGIKSEVVSATLLADGVILAHVLSSANVPEGPAPGIRQFRFTLVIVRDGTTWKIRSSSTTLVREMP